MRGSRWLAAALAAFSLQAGCARVNPYYDPEQPHHTPTGFRNLYPHRTPTTADFWRWQFQHWFQMGRERGNVALPALQADRAWLSAPSTDVRMTWVGHSTLLLQIGALNILTDPMFSERASPVSFAGPRRFQPPGIALADLPHIHAVLISHDHYDHLDLASVRALAAQRGGPPVFMVPLGVDVWFRMHVPQATELRPLDWWGQSAVGDAVFTLVPVQHWSGRRPFGRNHTLWGSWAVRAAQPAFSFFFGGDFGYSQDIHGIADRVGPFDLAALPIGAYEPRWFMRDQHINPAEAVRVHRELRAASSVGIHWGTFRLADEALERAPEDLDRARRYAGLPAHAFFVMRHGESRVWRNGTWEVRPPG